MQTRKLFGPGAGMLIALALFAAPAFSDEPKDRPVSPLTLIPQDTAGFVTLRVSALWDEPIIKDLFKQMEKSPNATQVIKELEQFMGMPLKEIDYLTAILPQTPKNHKPLLIITTMKSFDQGKVLSAMSSKPEKKTVGDKVYYEGNKGIGIHFVADRSVVVGDPKEVREYLEKKLDVSRDERFKNASDLLAKNTLVAVLDLSPYGKPIQDELAREYKGTEALFAVESAFVTLTGSKDLRLNLKLTYKDAAAAKDADRAARKLAEVLAEKLSNAQGELARNVDRPEFKDDPYAQWCTKDTIETLKELRINLTQSMLDQNGKELTADLTSKISAARLAVLVFNGAAVAKLAEARTFQEARIEAAVLQIRSLEEACQAYSLKNGEFPKTLDVLAKDGKIDREILTDPWDKKFRYDPAGPKHKGNKPDIWTVTPDGRTIGNFDTPKEGTKSPEK